MLFVLIRAAIRTQTEYLTNFLFTMVSNGLAMIADFIVIAIIFSGGVSTGGWDIYKIAILYSVVGMGFGFFRLFGEGIHRFERLILSGRFDALLLRPAPTLLQVALQQVDLKRIGVIVQALLVGLWGASRVHIPPDRAWIYFVLPFFSAAMIACVSTCLATIAFWTGRNDELIILGLYATRTASDWPLTIYNSVVQKFLTFIVPFATVGFYPVSYMLGLTDSLWALAAPVISCSICIPLSVAFWNVGVRHYTSTGT